MRYQGQVVIVTGAGQGIGKAVAIAYAALGAQVILAEKHRVAGVNVQQQIRNEQRLADFVQTDVSNPQEVVQLIETVAKRYQRIDVLINNAGISRWCSPLDIDISEWEQIINTNLRGTFLCSREAAKVMKGNGGGSIVNIASTRAIMSEPNSEAYAASKGGILSLTHALAASLGVFSIRVNAISPGWIETGDYSTLRDRDHQQHMSMRVGRPEDIARACLYLTDQGNEFINGANIVVDGGMTRKMIYEQ